ncbi:GNAT family N-acetyltransferase [Clostridium aminobutyricum]|uniref:GNAT family N-acetyltransferase n=1 Tax=Clostridium aminobutyricum TaxID=33953 RepID=A0A939D6D0_CLOAM|nr:GNAT family N-acetyltransferase [Clostridium aminobutyricum]MBN7771915.1 GNAT family N-acetyltransferase [Clostridium aminobutyricum]
MHGLRLKLSQTKEYDALTDLFMKNGLEFSKEEPVRTDVVKCWKITHGEEQFLAAGLALAKRQGEFIIDGIAVEPEYRKMKIGKIILNKAIEEVKTLGGNRIFLVARAPEFFRKRGFVTVSREDAPTFFECATCEQYNATCYPEVMRLDIH